MNHLASAYRILKTTNSETNTRRFRNLHFHLSVRYHGPRRLCRHAQDARWHGAVALRDSHGQKCWRIKAAAIDGMLGRNFDQWLQPGTPLNAPEHLKDRFTEVITTMNWKNNFKDVFPPVTAQAGQGQQQLLPAQITRLTGPDAMKTAKSNVCGQDLHTFALQPRTPRTTLRSTRVL
jgi:hypothetical protein